MGHYQGPLAFVGGGLKGSCLEEGETTSIHKPSRKTGKGQSCFSTRINHRVAEQVTRDVCTHITKGHTQGREMEGGREREGEREREITTAPTFLHGAFHHPLGTLHAMKGR